MRSSSEVIAVNGEGADAVVVPPALVCAEYFRAQNLWRAAGRPAQRSAWPPIRPNMTGRSPGLTVFRTGKSYERVQTLQTHRPSCNLKSPISRIPFAPHYTSEDVDHCEDAAQPSPGWLQSLFLSYLLSIPPTVLTISQDAAHQMQV